MIIVESAVLSAGKLLNEVISVGQNILKYTTRTMNEVVNIVDEMERILIMVIGEVIGIVDTSLAKATKILTEFLTVVSRIKIKFNGISTGLWSRVRKNIGSWRRQDKDL